MRFFLLAVLAAFFVGCTVTIMSPKTKGEEKNGLLQVEISKEKTQKK